MVCRNYHYRCFESSWIENFEIYNDRVSLISNNFFSGNICLCSHQEEHPLLSLNWWSGSFAEDDTALLSASVWSTWHSLTTVGFFCHLSREPFESLWWQSKKILFVASGKIHNLSLGEHVSCSKLWRTYRNFVWYSRSLILLPLFQSLLYFLCFLRLTDLRGFANLTFSRWWLIDTGLDCKVKGVMGTSLRENCTMISVCICKNFNFM